MFSTINLCRSAILTFLVIGTFDCQRPVLADDISFNKDIRPILSDACFQCHGPDEKKRQGNLRLDVSEAARKGGDSGPAIIPGKVDQGELWKRITSHDPELQMPPASSGKSLSEAQIQTLRKWIESGAEYQGHWAFIPVQRPNVPRLASASTSNHAIDTFIRHRLEHEGMAPAERASRETLIRRVTLDLTGLPPTLAEIDAFLADNSPNAWEKVVDRLLASPAYGERMAQQWLDFARYADSNGFQVDSSRQMWAWRDWVINAFNRNEPFDQFTINQLAGDMLPNPTQDQIVATGFSRNTRLNGEGGRIEEEWFAETVIDRVETVGLTWMGLTLNCCRCHDHKYDPISQREFYQLFAYFNSVDESGVLESEGGSPGRGNSRPVHTVVSPESDAEIARLQKLIASAKAHLAMTKATAGERQSAWEAEMVEKLKSSDATWKQLDVSEAKSVGGATLTKQPDGSWLASGNNPANDEYVIRAPLPKGVFTGILLECFPDPSLPNQSLGRYPNGNFVLTDIDIQIKAASLANPLSVTFGRAVADYEQNGYTVAMILEGQGKPDRNRRGWAVDGPTRRETCRAVFASSAPVEVPDGAEIEMTLRHDAINQHNIGRFRISASSMPSDTLTPGGSSFPESVKTALSVAVGDRTAEQKAELEKYFLEHGDAATKSAVAAVEKEEKALQSFREQLPIVMVMKERNEPRDAFILVRGQYDRKGDKVGRGTPASLPPMPAEYPQNRLGFAQWLVARNNPLTARVWANRTWERFFGTGLVKTTENLGSQSEWPSHPELLDWLAAEFMEPTQLTAVAGQMPHAWDVKALDKLIVMSETYQQSAKVTSAADPENRLLARGPRFRLSAETIRDQALAVSGLLVERSGGPSVRPFMPDGVWDETSRYGDLRGYKPDEGEGRHRRSLYTIWKRTAAPPSMLLFDAPSREICTVKRSRTNTPLQALALLNEPTYLEAAKSLGQRIRKEGGSTTEEQLAWGFRVVTGRKPSTHELEVLVQGMKADAEQLRAASANEAAKNEEAQTDELYTLTANILLNLDETVTRE